MSERIFRTLDFVSQAALVCFEINIFNTVIGYVCPWCLQGEAAWRERPLSIAPPNLQWAKDLHPAILISVLIPLYLALNIWSVSFFGEAEFWLAIGKVLLIIMLFFYTVITMLGGNPLGDRYGE